MLSLRCEPLTHCKVRGEGLSSSLGEQHRVFSLALRWRGAGKGWCCSLSICSGPAWGQMLVFLSLCTHQRSYSGLHHVWSLVKIFSCKCELVTHFSKSENAHQNPDFCLLRKNSAGGEPGPPSPAVLGHVTAHSLFTRVCDPGLSPGSPWGRPVACRVHTQEKPRPSFKANFVTPSNCAPPLGSR